MKIMQPNSARRLNFISGEDFYFLAYSILLVLEFLGGPGKRFKDHRKIVFLIQLLADDRLIGILDRSIEGVVKNPVDRELLFLSYTKAELHKREVFKILFSLQTRKLIKLERTEVAEILDVALISDNLPKDFLKSGEFDKERRNAERIKQLFPRLSALTFDTLIERLYRSRGVNVWVS